MASNTVSAAIAIRRNFGLVSRRSRIYSVIRRTDISARIGCVSEGYSKANRRADASAITAVAYAVMRMPQVSARSGLALYSGVHRPIASRRPK